jgi:Chlorophyllase
MWFIFVCGAFCNEESFSSYVNKAKNVGYKTKVLIPNTSPISSNYNNDFNKFKTQIETLLISEEKPNEVEFVFAGYSAGGKFAAKLASEFTTKGLYLMDPVDGPPPFQEKSDRFPALLESFKWVKKDINVKLVFSEFGQTKGFGGVACVPEQYGHTWFTEKLQLETKNIAQIQKAGHFSFHTNAPKFPLSLTCKAGENKDAGSESFNLFENFLSEI